MLEKHETRVKASAVSDLKAVFGFGARLWTRRNMSAWLSVILLVLLLKWGVFDLRRIPSDSMAPTLQGDSRFWRQDWVAVNKSAFGLRIPFTNQRLFRWGEPKRWDIVVFDSVDRSLPDETMIKRVAGLPEEKVVLFMNGLYVDDVRATFTHASGKKQAYSRNISPSDIEIARTILRLARNPSLPRELVLDRYVLLGLAKLRTKIRMLEIETLSDEEVNTLTSGIGPHGFRAVQLWMISELSKSGQARYGILGRSSYKHVPKDRYYVLGDNPLRSRDSRFFGWVPRTHLRGRAYAIIWPPSHIQDLSGFTSTVLGMALLIGIPGAVVLYEIVRVFLLTSWTVRSASETHGLRIGDRVFINKVAYGLKFPFLSRGWPWKKGPKDGELIAYRPGGRWSRLSLGRVKSSDEEGQIYTLSPLGESNTEISASPNQIVGRVPVAWWPVWRFRKLK